MRIIGALDHKPFLGVAIAAALGVMLGGAMKPDLAEAAAFRAPQLQSEDAIAEAPPYEPPAARKVAYSESAAIPAG